MTKLVVGAVLAGGISLLGYLSAAAFEQLNTSDRVAAAKNVDQDIQLAIVNTKLDQIIESLQRIERTQRRMPVDTQEKKR